MTKRKYLLPLLAMPITLMAAPETLTSPDGDIVLNFELQDGKPTYWVDFKGKEIIAPSHLGFSLFSESGRNSFEHQGKKAGADALSLKDGFKLVDTTRESVEETWQPPRLSPRLTAT